MQCAKVVNNVPKDTSNLRMERLNQLVHILRSGCGHSKKDLMEKLEYNSDKTFSRDLELLRDRFAVEIIYDRHKNLYKCTNAGEFLLRLSLPEDEVTALASGLKMARHFLPHLSPAADALWLKISAFLPKGLLARGEELGRQTVVALPVSEMDQTVFRRLTEAIWKKEPLRVSYSSPYRKNEKKERVIFPWGVYFQSHAWYLWAGSPEHKHGATWRISRIKNIRIESTAWLEAPEGLSAESYAGSAWFASPGELKYGVRLRIFRPLAPIVAETIWHPTQKIEKQPDGSIVYSANVPDLEEVARWAMSCAPYIEVLAPKELRERMLALGEDICKRHGGHSDETEA